MSEGPSQSDTALRRFSSNVLQRFVTPGLLSVKLANTLVLLLIEFMTDAVDAEFLKYASRFLTPSSYDDMVAERNVLHVCGYPLCDRKPFRKIFGKQVPQISYKPSAEAKTLASSYLTQYCSKYHFQSSMIYRAQLSDEAVWARVDVAYLRNGTGEWEQHIKLLEELVGLDREGDRRTIVEGQHRDLSESDVKQVMQSLSALQLKSKDHGSKEDGPAGSDTESPIQEMVRQKMQEEKSVEFNDSTADLQIEERDFERSRHIHDNIATAGPTGGSRQAIEGYAVGSAGAMKPPHAYVQWKERKERERDELNQGSA
ncbi:Rtr1/RPAP2 family-domain-containing protein [Lipomyces kononenkoae]|uniref:Rtr1/RPAP2 family-domain-containing protein n=1 Tax=Lipomyces kononenkoae TaxID=34357 RepID=A0ACC3T4S2_LIPKO